MLQKIVIAALSTVIIAAAQVLRAAESDPVMAINVLAIPDHVMRTRAQQLNQRLRESYPQGFALDASHVPHISLLHQFVRTRDLPGVYAAVEQVLSKHPLAGRELTTGGLEHSPWGPGEIVSLTVEKTGDLSAVQAGLLKALGAYAVASGGPDAFVTTADSPQIDAQTIDYVKTFVEKQTGDQFRPHITVGFSDKAARNDLAAATLAPTKFRIETVAVYQLGDLGTARKRLWQPAAAD